MASIPPVNDDAFLTAVVETLSREIRCFLKEPLMEIAEKEIDIAVNQAVAALRPRVELYVQEYDMKAVINLVVERNKPAA